MTETAIVIVACAAIGYALVSGTRAGRFLPPAFVFAVVGLVLAKTGLVPDVVISNDILQIAATATLVLVLFKDAAALRIGPPKTRARIERVALRLLLLGLPLSVALGTLVGWTILPGFGLIEALVVALILVPTDAALAQPVFEARGLPESVQEGLDAESGLNDGIGLPLLVVALTLAAGGSQGFGSIAAELAAALFLAPVVGGAVGLAGGRALVGAMSAGAIAGPWRNIAILAIAAASFAASEAVGGNGFIAAYCAGLGFNAATQKVHTEPFTDFIDSEGQILIQMTFLLFGIAILPGALIGTEPVHILYALLALTVIRMVPVALSLIGTGLSRASVLFIGWFGPRGVPSILYLILVVDESGFAEAGAVTHIAAWAIALSIVLHGLSARPGIAAYRRTLAGGGDGAAD